MSADYMDLFLGRIESILIEEETIIEGKPYLIGHNERYLKLAISSNKDISNNINQIMNVRINKKLNDEILLCDIK